MTQNDQNEKKGNFSLNENKALQTNKEQINTSHFLFFLSMLVYIKDKRCIRNTEEDD